MPVFRYIRLPFRFDVARLQSDLARLEAGPWQLHYQHKHYEGNWSALPLRSVGGRADHVIVAPQPGSVYADTPLLEQTPYFREVLSQFECPLLAVRVLKLEAGALIKEHRDADLSFEQGEWRIHVPVVTHPAVECWLDGERLILEAGECWYLNVNLPHSFRNPGPVHRVHLVIDAVVNDWARQLVAQPGLLASSFEPPPPDPATQRMIIAQLRSLNTETSRRLADEMEAGLTAE